MTYRQGGHARPLPLLDRAEVVANWGTMLQLLVSRPPRTSEEAWPLAIQHDLIAQDTLSGQTIRDHARNLIDRPSWFLHARP
jgi:hypothetical protein